jgi:hypothetical protein
MRTRDDTRRRRGGAVPFRRRLLAPLAVVTVGCLTGPRPAPASAPASLPVEVLPPASAGESLFERAIAHRRSAAPAARPEGGSPRYRIEGILLGAEMRVSGIDVADEVPARLLDAGGDAPQLDGCPPGAGEGRALHEHTPELAFWLALADLYANAAGTGRLSGAVALSASTSGDANTSVLRRSSLFSPAPAVQCVSEFKMFRELDAYLSPADTAAERWQSRRKGESESDRRARLGIAVARGDFAWSMGPIEEEDERWRLIVHSRCETPEPTGGEWMDLVLVCEAPAPLFARELGQFVATVGRDRAGRWVACVTPSGGG